MRQMAHVLLGTTIIEQHKTDCSFSFHFFLPILLRDGYDQTNGAEEISSPSMYYSPADNMTVSAHPGIQSVSGNVNNHMNIAPSPARDIFGLDPSSNQRTPNSSRETPSTVTQTAKNPLSSSHDRTYLIERNSKPEIKQRNLPVIHKKSNITTDNVAPVTSAQAIHANNRTDSNYKSNILDKNLADNFNIQDKHVISNNGAYYAMGSTPF